MKKICYFLFLGILITFTHNINANNYDIAMNGSNLDNTYVNVSDIQNNQYTYTHDVAQQIANYRIDPVPDDYFYGHIIINNDTDKTLRFNKINPSGSITPRAGYDLSQYYTVLEDFLFYSFNVNNGEQKVTDTAFANFAGTAITENANNLSFNNGYAQLNDYVYLNPGDTTDLYFDFSFSWQSDNRTISMGINALFTINFENATKHSVNTQVENGTIDESITDIIPGSNHTIKYQPKDGYQLTSVNVNGSEVDINTYSTSYTFSNINDNHVIKVKYALKDDSSNDQEETIDPTIPDNSQTKNPDKENSNNTMAIMTDKSNTDNINTLPNTGNSYLYGTLIVLFIVGGLVYTSRRFKKN